MKSLIILFCLFTTTVHAADQAFCTSMYVDLSTNPPTETKGPSLTVDRTENGEGFNRVEDPTMDVAYSMFYDWNNSDVAIGFATLSLSEALSAQGKLYRPDKFSVAFVKRNWGSQFGIWISCALQ